jgi:two-component system sensor histidine kinase GlrK
MQFKLRYPRSFVKLLSIGFALVALPLLIGLIGNAVSIRKLAVQSQQTVYQAVQVTQASRALQEKVSSLERAARQYLVLKDPALAQAYRQLHEGFVETGRRLAALPLADLQRSELERLLGAEREIFAAVDGGRPEQAAAGFDTLAELANELLRHSSESIEREVESLRALAGDAERVVYGQLLALLPVAVFLVLGFSHLLSRPIAELDQGIRGLGEGRFERKIAISGPEDLEQLGRQLDWLRLRLIQLEEQKSRFLRHASHELKTPLTALREGSDLLAEQAAGPLTAQQEEIVRILRDNSLHLRRLIEDLLSYNATEFQQASLKLHTVDPRDLAAHAADKQRLALAAKDLTLRAEVGDFALVADGERLRVVLDNLLSNAIKFSPSGATIELIWRIEEDHAVLEVADEGPGVTPEDRERIFDPFYQGATRGASAVKGSGLGLSIAREHVLAHGGRIELVAGSGARFRVVLPLGPTMGAHA